MDLTQVSIIVLPPSDRIGGSLAGNWAKFGANQNSLESSYDNKQFPHAPHITVSPYYQHVFNLANGATVTGRVESVIQSPQYTDTTNAANGYEHTHAVSNIYTTYDGVGSKYSVTLYVRNVENTATIQSYTAGNSATGVPDEAILGAPRTYGFNIVAHL